MNTLAEKVAARFVVAADNLDMDGFAKELESHLRLDGRQVYINTKGFAGRRETIFVNFINLPKGVGGAGGGAEAENNRMSFTIRSFDQDGGPPPTGKLKVEMRTTAMPREFNMRAKSGSPAAVAQYLAAYINKIVKEIPPNFTHTKQAGVPSLPEGMEGFPETPDEPVTDPLEVAWKDVQRKLGGSPGMRNPRSFLKSTADRWLVPGRRLFTFDNKNAWAVFTTAGNRGEAARFGKAIQKSLIPVGELHHLTEDLHSWTLFAIYAGGYVAIQGES